MSAIALGAAVTPDCAHAREQESDNAKFVAFSAPSVLSDIDIALAEHNADPAYLDLMEIRTRKGGLNVVSSYRLRLSPPGDEKGRMADRTATAPWGGFGAEWTGPEQRMRAGHGVVVRVQRDLAVKHPFDWKDPAFSFFVAADSDAVAWRLDKATGNEPKRFYYQSDRVKIGDLEAGLAVEAGPARLGLAYVEREIRSVTPSGVGEVSRDESFVGVTLTLK